ncbi:MAG TPA: ABC transporter ATP-binding protein [Candidatus Saccharimonadales bacterium]|nr:ABC transporter ATP-binding protein [Candidatus Saccharimonadales bacterium]
MMPKIYAAIEAAIASGTPPQYVAANLIGQGWPPGMVNEALNAWLSSHGRLQQKTGFRDWLKKYKHKALPAIITLVTISVISSSILLLRPWPTKIMVDSAFGNVPAPGFLESYTHQPVLILITSLLTIAIFLIGSLFAMVQDYLILRLGFWLDRGVKEESFRHILHLPLYHQERLSKGDYIYRQNNLTNSLSDLVLDTTASISQSTIMIIGVLGIMLWFNLKLTLITVIILPFLFILVRLFGPKLGKISQALTKVASDTSSNVTESIDNAETVQSFTLEEKQINKANNLWKQTYNLSKRGLFWSRGYRFSNSLLIILGTSAVMYFGGTAALNGQMTLGELLIFMTYMGYLLGPVEELAGQIAARNQKLVDVSRVYEVLTDHEGIENLRNDKHFPGGYGRIEFQNVSYAYNNIPVLSNINLVVEPTQKIGIIGPSGSGKSTLLKLIPLFIEPSRGRILIDNVDVQTVSVFELRHRIAWISQTPQLFNESLKENLLDGDVQRAILPREIDQATGAAYVNEFADHLPGGLESMVGEGGNTLSGGQKQRLAIARGLLKNAPIVCMDEPTAALDSKSEKYIRDSIAKLIANKTVLMVTHRKALLSLMDKIYVMDGTSLRDVNDLGGLDAYLQKITDTEVSAPSAAKDEFTEAQRLASQQKADRLAAENLRLQQNLHTIEQKPSDNVGPDGTIYIGH